VDVGQVGFVRAAGIRALQLHQLLYERTGGRIGHRLLGIPNLLLRTVGAKTGQQRTSCLTYARDGDSYLVVASMGGAPVHPGWYHNLRADPAVEIQIGTHRQRATARVVNRGDADYDRMWKRVNENNHNRYKGYQRQTERPIPIVVLTPG
jgi:deazaflavin-dependent oxidoreductase (nitroreductase family)